MCEGNPDSPQSVVYDHSEKGLLGSELWDDDYSSETGNWNPTGDNTITNVDGELNINYVNQADGANIDLRDGTDLNANLVVGAFYKLSFQGRYSGGSSGSLLRLFNAADGLLGNASALTTSKATYSLYFTATNAIDDYIQLSGLSSGNVVILDNFSLKEVKMGNHATTVFYGDDLATGTFVNNGYNTFTGASDAGFTAVETDSATSTSSNTDHIAVVQGKTYQLSFTGTLTSGQAPTVSVREVAGGSSTGLLADTAVSAGANTPTFTCTAASMDVTVQFTTTADTSYAIASLTFKEVGVSTAGYDTAVEEQTIPQVPLMLSLIHI